MFIVLGNYIPKTKRNNFIGIRVSWSMYNDVTWMKCNRCGSVTLIAAGLLTVITAIFVHSILATVLLLVYLLTSIIVTLIYAHKIYVIEISKNK